MPPETKFGVTLLALMFAVCALAASREGWLRFRVWRRKRRIRRTQAAYFKRQERLQAESIRARARVSRRVS